MHPQLISWLYVAYLTSLVPVDKIILAAPTNKMISLVPVDKVILLVLTYKIISLAPAYEFLTWQGGHWCPGDVAVAASWRGRGGAALALRGGWGEFCKLGWTITWKFVSLGKEIAWKLVTWYKKLHENLWDWGKITWKFVTWVKQLHE